MHPTAANGCTYAAKYTPRRQTAAYMRPSAPHGSKRLHICGQIRPKTANGCIYAAKCTPRRQTAAYMRPNAPHGGKRLHICGHVHKIGPAFNPIQVINETSPQAKISASGEILGFMRKSRILATILASGENLSFRRKSRLHAQTSNSSENLVIYCCGDPFLRTPMNLEQNTS